nr:hypothetical protein [Tanacetum cinerariifolium]
DVRVLGQQLQGCPHGRRCEAAETLAFEQFGEFFVGVLFVVNEQKLLACGVRGHVDYLAGFIRETSVWNRIATSEIIDATMAYSIAEAASSSFTKRRINADTNFEAGGTLARMIRPGERALALSIDEIIGAGGQLSPGDYVDVLLYLPSDQTNPDRSAQTVVPALRVLSVGALMGPVNQGQQEQGISRDERAQQ